MIMTISHDDAMLVKMEKVRRRILCRQDLGRKSVPNFEDRDKSVTFKNEDFGWFTWVLKTRLIEKKYPSFLLMPNFRKLRDDSKYVSLKIGS